MPDTVPPVAANARDDHATQTAAGLPATRILGVPVNILDMRAAVTTILGWVDIGRAHYVCIRDVHGVMRAQEDPQLQEIHENAGMVTADGMPLVWISRKRGYPMADRVCGADLVDALCAASVEHGVAHYFYGGKPGVADRMADHLRARHPGLAVAGTATPPFGAMSKNEDDAATATIAASSPGIVWVGLSTPKQEYWMRDHVGRIPGAALIGVGAAFDFYAGDVKRAPKWMHKSGLEWLHRLISEPRRLWRRYLIMAPKFVWQVMTNGRKVGR